MTGGLARAAEIDVDGIQDGVDNCPTISNADQADADGAADADSDGDGINNRDEFRSGTDPQDKDSRLHLTALKNATGGGIEVRWSSVTGKFYAIDRATNSLNGFQFHVLESNIPGAATSTAFTDTNPIPKNEVFYRTKTQ